MTLLAGAFSLSGTLAKADELLASLSALISRNASDRREVLRADGALLLKVDIGAFGCPALLDEDGITTFVAGEPIVPSPVPARTRMTDTAALHQAFRHGSDGVLAQARGQFSVAHYDRHAHRLTLATDKLGIRALYWSTDGETVIFSSTIRLLEALPLVSKRVDFRGLGELLAIGFPLGARTAYEGISMLRGGEVIEFADAKTSARRYWRWQDITRSDENPAALSKSTFDAFCDAVRVRGRGDLATTSLLSGGLDSRCIVGALRRDDVAVHTINLASPETEEREFAAQFASSAGTVHEEHELDRSRHPVWIFTLADILERSTAPIRSEVERPNVVWSGDGGSVGMGLVHMERQIIERSRAGDAAGLVDAYFQAERMHMPGSLLSSAAAAQMRDAPKQGVLEELANLQPADLDQAFYFFLMLNDQRRALQPHFEQMDLHRLEVLLPFLDSDLLRIMASVPIELRFYHAFYNSWLAHFPAAVSTTCWQAYPGHVPCPVPHTHVLLKQWDSKVLDARRIATRGSAMPWVLRKVTRESFPSGLMRRHALMAAGLVHSMGLRDYGYLLSAAEVIQNHSAMCDG